MAIETTFNAGIFKFCVLDLVTPKFFYLNSCMFILQKCLN